MHFRPAFAFLAWLVLPGIALPAAQAGDGFATVPATTATPGSDAFAEASRLFFPAASSIEMTSGPPPLRSDDAFGTPRRGEGGDPNRSRNLKAIGYSILLPGLAQYKMGRKTRGLAFMTAEVAVWAAFANFRVRGEIRKDSYIELAELQGDVQNANERDDDFYRQIGSWLSSDDYDELVQRDARALFGDDLAAREEYFDANRTPADDRWEWGTITALLRYREKRSDSQRAFKRSRDMMGIAVVNRLVSMIDAVLISRGLPDAPVRLGFEADRVAGETVGRVGLTGRLP